MAGSRRAWHRVRTSAVSLTVASVLASLVVPAFAPVRAGTSQVIDFTLPLDGVVGGKVALAATATSGLSVSFTVDTSAVCSSDGSALTLSAVGTCTVTAHQAGNATWDAAPSVAASIAVGEPGAAAVGTTLGTQAFNGLVRTTVVDPASGVTYVGGDFTQMGPRTGSVAVVDGPDTGSDALTSASPDVVASGATVFADDDSHYFVAGQIASVDGDPVQREPVLRMNADGTPDLAWQLSTTCSSLPDWAKWGVPRYDFGEWLAFPLTIDPINSNDSAMGLGIIDKATGVARRAGAGSTECGDQGRIWPTIDLPPVLAQCVQWTSCSGSLVDARYDASSGILATVLQIGRQQPGQPGERMSAWLIGYDLNAGQYLWQLPLQSAPPAWVSPNTAWWGTVTHMGFTGGGLLVSGRFPLDQDQTQTDKTARMLLVDTASGAILQRWSKDGEQSLADPVGPAVAPATPCTPASDGATSYEMFDYVPLPNGHVAGYGVPVLVAGVQRFAVCDYAVTGTGSSMKLAATQLGSLDATPPNQVITKLPSALYKDRFLVGGYDAFDLQTATQVDGWHPSPSISQVSLVAVGSSVVMAHNELYFVHGEPAVHVAALDANLAPVPGFTSGLTFNPAGTDWFSDLAVGDGVVFVAGRPLTVETGQSGLVALDATTGAVRWNAASVDSSWAATVAVDPATNRAFLGRVGGGAPALLAYAPSGGAWAKDPLFAPAIGAGGGLGTVTAARWHGSRLYIGGGFDSVDGQPRWELARFAANGSLDGWKPELVGGAVVPTGGGSGGSPQEILEIGGSVLVTGQLSLIVPQAPADGPGWQAAAVQTFVVYDATTAARLRPDTDGTPWYDDAGVDSTYGAAVLGDYVYVALGTTGIAAFDAATFTYQPQRSVRSFPGWGASSVFAVGVSGAPVAPAAMSTATAASEPMLLIGGSLTRWGTRTASNVVGVTAAALDDDRAAPVTSAVSMAPKTAVSLSGTKATLNLRWTGTDVGKAGVARYELAQRKDTGSWTTISRTITTGVRSVSLATGASYRFRVRAIDHAANVGEWTYSPTISLRLTQQTSTAVKFSTGWTTTTSSSYSGGSARYATKAGAAAKITATARSIAFVTTAASTRGKARIYVDGTYVTTIDLKRSTRAYRYVAWQRTWSAAATHTVKIVVAGTSGRPRVDVDAFIVVK